MTFSISGYVLEPVRVGQSNSPFTQTPDNYISDQGDFDTAFPSDESEPRADYLVLALDEGGTGLLVDSEFAWSKNDIINRFGYDSRGGRFRPFPGAPPVEAGILSADSNTERLKVTPPVQVAVDPSAPYRLSVGSTGSGTEITVSLVALDSSFGTPAAGTAELSLETGNLNWSVADLTTYVGQPVRWQRQQFYAYADSTGRLGLPDETLMLSPKPGTGQIPLLRFGFGLYLEVVEVPTEGSFGSPVAGTVEWSLDTGLLNLSAADITTFATTPLYYDGVLLERGLALPFQDLGDIASPSAIVSLPTQGVDLIFSLPAASEYHQFPQFSYTTTFNAGVSGVVQVNPGTGAVQLSTADQATYAGEDVRVTFGDLLIEKGVTVRLFRTPVNLNGTAGVNDVTVFYDVENAIWADPILAGASQVFLPSKPIDDSGYPLTVKVEQGQGSYVDSDLPRLDGTTPPVGIGYFLDFDTNLLNFAERKEDVDVFLPTPVTEAILPDPLILEGNAVLELETAPGSGTYTTLTPDDDVLFEANSGLVKFIDQYGTTVVEASSGATSGSTFTDTAAGFISDGVLAGQYLEILSPATVQGVYTILSVDSPTTLTVVETFSAVESNVVYRIHEDQEVLASRFFSEVVLVDPSTNVSRIRSLGTATNAPRLNIPTAYVASSGFRLGSETFATTVVVADDGSFTAPAAGTVEISEDTGNVNFAAADLGAEAFWVRSLEPKVDYRLSPELGLIQFTERTLALEEVLITYTPEPPFTEPPTDPGPPTTEYGRFLVRKEITQDHLSPTSTLSFNPTGLPVAENPTPAVFRGGRPQVLGVQCVVDTDASTITFQADNQVTDALPHGATVGPTERVYIDYHVLRAVGGEKTLTVLNYPMRVVSVSLEEDANEFQVLGDHAASFPAGYLLRVERDQVYLLDSSSYDAGSDTTTVTLAGTQVFKETLNDPLLYVSSGPTPLVSTPSAPAFFVSEMAAFESIPRGSQTFRIAGNRTNDYRSGTVALFTDGSTTFTDFALVLASAYDATGRTEVSLASSLPRQYVQGSQLLLHSALPVFEPPTVEVATAQPPELVEGYTVFRKSSGEVGVVLVEGTDYTIDQSGKIVLTEALLPDEEVAIWYSGLRVVEAGLNLRASYTCRISPSDTNGLAGQVLRADYSIFSPDSFYYRVETMTNFRGEYAQELSSSASSGSSGPQTENASQPSLYEQGRPSLYFDERHLANQDIIARSTLLFYNESVNFLEAYLRALDGRVVGNNDGLFLFDGTTGTLNGTDNQIDDTVKISDAPYTITYPPFAVTSVGTFRKAYRPGSKSRFYPTLTDFFAVSAVTGSSETGDEVVDTGTTKLTAVSRLYTRLAWGVVTESTALSGSGTLKLDFADGTEPGFTDQAETYARPPFQSGMKCVVQRRDGTFINDASSPITISAVAPNEITITGLAGEADSGTTVYRSPADDSSQSGADVLNYYQSGRDFTYDADTGQLRYVEGSIIPLFENVPLVAEQALTGQVNFTNTLTAPVKFPALYGGIEDDDGDLSFPIQTPDPDSEQDGYLAVEDSLIHTSTGLLRGVTTDSFEGVGSLDAPRTTITLDSGTFPAPVPQVHDLVRIIDGLNGPSYFVRVTGTTASSVTVDTAFASVDSAFTFQVAVSASIVSGTATFPTTSSMLDGTATFLTDVVPGQTVVVTSGSNGGERRQITTVLSDTSLEFTPALPSTTGGTYRIDDSISTFGGSLDADYMTAWEEALLGQTTITPTQGTYILDFLNQVFTDIATGATGATTTGLPTLDDAGATFLTDEVSQAHYVYIETGADAGFYQVTNVNSETQIEVDSTFPATLTGVSYRVVSLFGVSSDSVDSMFALYQGTSNVAVDAATYYGLVMTPVSVMRLGVPDTDSFARATVLADLDARDAQVDARNTAIDSAVSTVEEILASSDRLYDARYTWIDARINLEDGLIVQQSTAESNRLKEQEKVLNELIKLLAVEGA